MATALPNLLYQNLDLKNQPAERLYLEKQTKECKSIEYA
jgi:hypothetical protein